MHLYDTLKGEQARNFSQTTLKLSPPEWDLDAVKKVEVHGTDIDDPGEDFCEYRVFDVNDKVICVRREMGY